MLLICAHTHSQTNTHTFEAAFLAGRETDKITVKMKTHIVTVGGWKSVDRVRACRAGIFLYPPLM